jgi:RNA polymerase sigma-70 factor (ECF subfamily)
LIAAGAIDEALRAGRAAWPAVRLDRAAFATWVEASEIQPGDLLERGAELFLVAGCVAQDDEALAAFERQMLAPLAGNIGGINLTPDQADEVRQQLRCHLLLPPQTRIGKFRGQGPLAAWVRVCAVRAALAVVSGRDQQPRADALALEHLVAPEGDQEISAIKGQYREAFQSALGRCFESLPARQKTLLRMHFLDGMSIDAMSLVFGVHRATVARWLVAIRRQVLADISRELAADLRATSSELSQLVHLVRSEVHVSILRILGEP